MFHCMMFVIHTHWIKVNEMFVDFASKTPRSPQMHWNWAVQAVFKAADNQRSDWLEICKVFVSWIISHILLYNMKTSCHIVNNSIKNPSSDRVSDFSWVKSCVLMHRRIYCFVIVKCMLLCLYFGFCCPDFAMTSSGTEQTQLKGGLACEQ